MAQHDCPPADGGGPTDENPTDELLASLDTDAIAGEADAALLPSGEPMRTVFRTIGVLEQIVGSVLLLLILILVLAQVAQRFFPGSWPWTGELSRYSMVWLTFLLAGYLMAYAPHHIAIHIIDFVVRGRWKAVIALFVNVVILVTSLVLIYGTYGLIDTDIGQVTPAGQMPLRLVNMVPLVGLSLVAVRAVMAIVIRDVPALLGRTGDAT